MDEYWKTCPYSESQRICFDKVNPKRIGKAAWYRYDRYKSAQTIGEYFEICKGTNEDRKVVRVDLQYDISKNICRLLSDKPVAPPADASQSTGLKGSSQSSAPIPSASSDGRKAGTHGTGKAGAKDPTLEAPEVVPPASVPVPVVDAEGRKETATAMPPSQQSVNGSNPKSGEETVATGGAGLQPKEQEPKSGGDKAPPESKNKTPEVPETTRLEDQSLFSLLGSDQPKKLEPKKAARKDLKDRKEPKEAKETKEPKEPKDEKEKKEKKDKSARKPSNTLKHLQPKRERQERHNRQTENPKAGKVLHVREFVRDLVVDYIEGQPDPPEKSASTDGKQVVRLRDKDSKEPMAPPNRNGFIWVADAGNSGYTHDAKFAHPLPSAVKGARCDVCGKSCVSERLYRVRCYSRRLLGAVSELKDPRVMRRETYLARALQPIATPELYKGLKMLKQDFHCF